MPFSTKPVSPLGNVSKKASPIPVTGRTLLHLCMQAQQAAEANLQQATSSSNQQQHSLQQQHAQQAQHAQQLAGQVADLEERCGMLTQHRTAAEADAACAMRQAESAGMARQETSALFAILTTHLNGTYVH